MCSDIQTVNVLNGTLDKRRHAPAGNEDADPLTYLNLESPGLESNEKTGGNNVVVVPPSMDRCRFRLLEGLLAPTIGSV
jgi:hypothetical protein